MRRSSIDRCAFRSHEQRQRHGRGAAVLNRTITLGTRGSDLARVQTAMAEAAIRARGMNVDIEVSVIRTGGDERTGAFAPPRDGAGRKGLFTAEIEQALLQGRIDVAVHSAKDLPSEDTKGLQIGAVLPRGPAADVLIARDARTLSDVRRGGMVATGSVRRQQQLRDVRPDLAVADLRGNVPTRLRKLIGHPWEAIILAAAGLERLGLYAGDGMLRFEGLAFHCSVLPVDQFVPAGGQGIIALQARADDGEVIEILRGVDDRNTHACLRIERQFLQRLGGDCRTPVGVLASIREGMVHARAQLFDPLDQPPVSAEISCGIGDAEVERAAAELLEQINEKRRR